MRFVTQVGCLQLRRPEQPAGVAALPAGGRRRQLVDTRDEFSRRGGGLGRRTRHGQSRGQLPLLSLPATVHSRGGRPNRSWKVT